MARDLIQKNVSLSAEVRDAASRVATAQASSVNDLLVGILADHFRVRFEGTGRRSPGVQKIEDGIVNLKVPPRLAEKLDAAKSRQPAGSRTLSGVVEPILREHFQLAAVAA